MLKTLTARVSLLVKRYPATDVAQLGGGIVRHIAADIRRAADYMRLVVGEG